MKWLPAEVIRLKRDNHTLTQVQIDQFIRGITDQQVADSQIAALAMAIYFNGLSEEETLYMTLSMRDSGTHLTWDNLHLPGPTVDKHSTGGLGDVVSLMLGPMIAACGGFVPMISGRGLGHTGGTLDKLSSIPGYTIFPSPTQFQQVVRDVGVAIIGQTTNLAPADRRFYAIRDISGTVESIGLITASILSKKLAEGLNALVMDIKTGNGAFMPTYDQSVALAKRIVDVGQQAGVTTSAIITDMSQPLAPCAGNAIEVLAAIQYLTTDSRPERLHQVTMALGSQLLVDSQLADNLVQAQTRLQHALDSGTAADVFAKMVSALGGPTDLISHPEHYLQYAPIIRPVLAEQTGFIYHIDTHALGMSVCCLGGGRTVPNDKLDLRVGLSDCVALGHPVDTHTPLLFIHAADENSFNEAKQRVKSAIQIKDHPPKSLTLIDQTISSSKKLGLKSNFG